MTIYIKRSTLILAVHDNLMTNMGRFTSWSCKDGGPQLCLNIAAPETDFRPFSTVRHNFLKTGLLKLSSLFQKIAEKFPNLTMFLVLDAEKKFMKADADKNGVGRAYIRLVVEQSLGSTYSFSSLIFTWTYQYKTYIYS